MFEAIYVWILGHLEISALGALIITAIIVPGLRGVIMTIIKAIFTRKMFIRMFIYAGDFYVKSTKTKLDDVAWLPARKKLFEQIGDE